MNKLQFAHKNGFNSYLDMQISSKVVYKDASTWLVTRTNDGFLAWSDNAFDKPLGYFDTFDQAKREISDEKHF